MSDDTKAVIKRLDQLVSLVARAVVKGMKPTAAITVLGTAGLERQQIAQIVGTTASTVSVRLSEARRRKKQKTAQ